MHSVGSSAFASTSTQTVAELAVMKAVFTQGNVQVQTPAEKLAEATFDGVSVGSTNVLLGAEITQELSIRLKDKERELNAQLEKNAELELSLWAAEHELQTMSTAKPTLQEFLLPDEFGMDMPWAHDRHVTPQIQSVPGNISHQSACSSVVAETLTVSLCVCQGTQQN